MTVDLTNEERQLLINLLTIEIEASRFPLSPRIEAMKRIREKLRGSEALAVSAADVSTSKRKPRR